MFLFSLRVVNQLVQGSIGKLNLVRNVNKPMTWDVSFRAWPIDLDTYFHVNNACYLRVAELARWRLFPETKMFDYFKQHGIMFLATENTVKYYKPIAPFQRYIVSTSLSTSDDKWFYYNHTFLQHPTEVKDGNTPIVFANVVCKAVLKEKSGKTVKVSSFAPHSELYRELMTSSMSAQQM
jgi:acyl-CoA thioesterase FadM